MLNAQAMQLIHGGYSKNEKHREAMVLVWGNMCTVQYI